MCCQVKIILYITIRHRCDPGFTILWFKKHKWWSYHSFTERRFKMSKISIIKLETSDGFVKSIQVFTITIWDDSSKSNLSSKYLTLKPYLWRSIQRWAYLWHLYSWLWFTLFSKGTVSSSIEIQFLILSITTRSGLSLVNRRSGGIVHGFSPRSTLIIRLLTLTWLTNSVILLSVLSWCHVYLPWSSINLQPESTGAIVSQSPQRSHAWLMQIIFSGKKLQHWVQEQLCYTPG